METKSLCAKISVELHNKITTEKEESGLTLNEYVEQLITEYYEVKKGGIKMANTEIRTLAVQISVDLMDRLDAHLEKRGLKKKQFLTSLIEKVLEDAEKEEQNNGFTDAEGE